ncbi:MAG: plastocyanin/azurin family copper-binding protein [Thermoproteota archaeon]|nr:plastocyanin/azurin family copper-binding protein [Thermoproteota archaeon]
MTCLNNNNDHPVKTATAATIISVLTIAMIMMLTSTIIAAPVTATTTTATTASSGNNTTTSTSSSEAPSLSGIKLSSQPIYQESVPPGKVTPINQTHISATHIGNGTLTLPNSNQTINTISNGTAIASLATPSAIAKETIRVANGETATITIYEIIQFNNPTEAPLGGGKGIKIIIFHTNSTGMLAPLDGVIAAGINDIQPNGESELTAWKWESGIPLPPLSTNTTSTSTNAATSSETNVTTTAAGTTEGGGEEEEQQQANQGGGAIEVSIVPGASGLTDTAYSPNPIQVGVDGRVTWINGDTQPHTVTSGENAAPDGRFDSGILAPRGDFEHTFTEAGEYPYFCLLHPNMVGTVSVS